MYKAKMHLGHNVLMRHPTMERYIFGCRNGTDIIDLDQVEIRFYKSCPLHPIF